MSTPPTTAPEPSSPADVETELETLIRARYPIIYVTSFEEERVEDALAEVARRRGKRLCCWSAVRGLHDASETLMGKRSFAPTTTDVMVAFDEVARIAEPTVFLFKDLHPLFTQHAVVRKLRELALHLKSSPKTLVLVSHAATIPPELEKDLTVLELRLPGPKELGGLLDGIAAQVSKAGRHDVALEGADRETLLKAALGLTLKEAENAFARALIERGRLTAAEVGLILAEKKRAIRKSGILEYFEAQQNLHDVGGLTSLKEWVRKRSVAFTEEARAFGLPPPRGLLLLGVQGCGKSLCAKAISQVWNLPLLRLDMGRIFSSFVGSSEENMRRAIATAESVAPAILWIDEIEKAFAGTRGGESDAGASSRVFATFLTWLQEKTAPVFVIATANNIATLPPELLRKGRLDEIFFVDLPSAAERREILRIHLRNRGRNADHLDLDRLVAVTEGYSGSEIEQVVIAALYEAFDHRRDIVADDLARAATQSVPLSQTMHEEIDTLRQWAASRARPASSEG
ncbi:MAG: AAA family ATPase [Proteobacteria bacterium]|nr:AAA family ATPase [Pseudomonadota bacterium]